MADDLETWLERAGLTEADRELQKWLRMLSAEAGRSGEAADRAYRAIHREVVALRGRKLRAERERAHQAKLKSIKQRQRGTEGWHVRLVRAKAYELGIGQPRRGWQQALWLALEDFELDEQERRVLWKETDLTPIERRAIAILGGAQRAAKKNFLEVAAIRLADAVIAEWFSPRGKPGRPAGSKIRLARKAMDNPRLASVAEVIEGILPIIEQLAGPKKTSAPESTMIMAIASAVRSAADLDCTLELAANAVRVLYRAAHQVPDFASFSTCQIEDI
jgi:hypothetical protein